MSSATGALKKQSEIGDNEEQQSARRRLLLLLLLLLLLPLREMTNYCASLRDRCPAFFFLRLFFRFSPERSRREMLVFAADSSRFRDGNVVVASLPYRSFFPTHDVDRTVAILRSFYANFRIEILTLSSRINYREVSVRYSKKKILS